LRGGPNAKNRGGGSFGTGRIGNALNRARGGPKAVGPKAGRESDRVNMTEKRGENWRTGKKRGKRSLKGRGTAATLVIGEKKKSRGKGMGHKTGTGGGALGESVR